MITKIETTNISKFLEEARYRREQAVELLNSGTPGVSTIRDAYRIVMDADEYTEVSFLETRRTAADLRAELVSAAIRAGQYGASEKQIDFIVSLCSKNNDFATTGYESLTVKQASNIINDLLK